MMDMVTPPILPELAWSYSALEAFETCAMQFYLTRVAKTHGQQKGKAAYQGDEVHEAMADYINKGKEPPLTCRKLKELVDKLAVGALDIVAEAKQGLRRDLSLCGYFDDDVAVRIIIDFFAVYGNAAIMCDWKTSSLPRETTAQLRIASWLLFARYPEVQRVYAMFVYTKHENRGYAFDRANLSNSVNKILPRVEQLKHAYDTREFLPTPCWLCRKFCAVTECRYHGK